MIVQTLPLYTEANYRHLIVLDEIAYNLAIRWNVRSRYWHLSLYTADNLTAIIDNRKIVPEVNLLDKAYSNPNAPSGSLMVLGNGKPLAFDTANLDYKLYYIK